MATIDNDEDEFGGGYWDVLGEGVNTENGKPLQFSMTQISGKISTFDLRCGMWFYGEAPSYMPKWIEMTIFLHMGNTYKYKTKGVYLHTTDQTVVYAVTRVLEFGIANDEDDDEYDEVA